MGMSRFKQWSVSLVALAKSDFDYFGGGGLKDPAHKRNNSSNYQGNALELARKNGYTVVTDKDEFMALDAKDGKVLATNFDILGKQNVSFQKFSAEVLEGFKQGDQAAFAAMKPLITKHFGLKFDADPSDPMALKSHEVIKIMQAFERSMTGDVEKSKDPETYLLYGGYDPLTVTLTHILNQKAGMAWTSYKHTGVPVTTSAVGVGAEAFSGAYDNTDIALKIMTNMGLEAKVRYADSNNEELVAAQ